MPDPFWTRDYVAEHLGIPARAIQLYEARGLVQATHSETEGDGYGPAEIRRIWTIVTYQRDLGVNLAGVEAILHLSGQLEQLHRRLRVFADSLDDAIREFEDDPDHGQT